MVASELYQLEQEISKLDSMLDFHIEQAISYEMKGMNENANSHYQKADRVADRIDAQKRLIEEIKRG